MSRVGYDEARLWQRGLRAFGATPPGTWLFSRLLRRLDAPLLQASDGRYSVTSLASGLPIISLTTTGAKSGQPRTVPLIAIPDDGRLILIASNWGSGKLPAWYYNATANLGVTVTLAGESTAWRAEELSGREREVAWEKAAAAYPGYRQYAARNPDQTIPVLALTPHETDNSDIGL